MDNPLHRYSVVVVLLPLIQEAVNDVILTWTAHTVRAVQETGVNRPSHIPQLAFQARERESKIVLPPPCPEDGQVDIQDAEDIIETVHIFSSLRTQCMRSSGHLKIF